MLIVSISIFIGFVKPEIDLTKTQYEENKITEQRLGAIAEKRENIEKLKQDYVAKKEIRDFFNNYFPSKKSEERALDTINFLAKESSIVLTDVIINKESNVNQYSDAEVIQGQSKLASAKDTFTAVAKNENIAVVPTKNSYIINAVGNYDKIKIFLDLLSEVNMMNNIVSVNVLAPTEENENSQPQELSEETQEVNQSLDSNLLTIELEIEFYYLDAATSENYFNQPIFTKSEFSGEYYEKVKTFVKRDIADLEVIEKSKSNPFQ